MGRLLAYGASWFARADLFLSTVFRDSHAMEMHDYALFHATHARVALKPDRAEIDAAAAMADSAYETVEADAEAAEAALESAGDSANAALTSASESADAAYAAYAASSAKPEIDAVEPQLLPTTGGSKQLRALGPTHEPQHNELD